MNDDVGDLAVRASKRRLHLVGDLVTALDRRPGSDLDVQIDVHVALRTAGADPVTAHDAWHDAGCGGDLVRR